MGLFNFNRTDINEGVAQYSRTAGAVLLDVRTKEEYSQGHIYGAVNLPLSDIHLIDTVVADKNTPVFVHCLSGARSGQALSYLKRLGYSNVTNIGGISTYTGKLEK